MELPSLSVQAILTGLKKKQFSCRELTQSYLARIDALESDLHAFLAIDREGALSQAATVDALIASGDPQPSLSGVPIALKDVIVTKGMPTTAGSKILAGYLPPYDAFVVKKLKAQGVVMVGKTNCDEFAMGGSGENSAYGPTKNPWDHERVPGGSSSGSAAAVAAGLVSCALGSDTGGSIRQPAGFCGIVGLKPTYGRVSRHGLIALASSLDQIGPLTRSVEDAALLLNVIAGCDENDATSVAQPLLDLPRVRRADVSGLRLGIPKEYFVAGLDPDVEKIIRQAVADLEHLGAQVQEVSLPHTEYALAVYYLLQPAEASANLARYDGVRYGLRQDDETLEGVYRKTRQRGFGDEVKRRIMIGTYALSAGYYDAYYLKAQKVRTLIRQDFVDVFQKVDAIVTPTSPTLPFKLGENLSDPLTMYLVDVFTVGANIAGLPGLSLPAGWVRNLPVGLQLLGPLWSEETLLTLGAALERTLNLSRSLPRLLS